MARHLFFESFLAAWLSSSKAKTMYVNMNYIYKERNKAVNTNIKPHTTIQYS